MPKPSFLEESLRSLAAFRANITRWDVDGLSPADLGGFKEAVKALSMATLHLQTAQELLDGLEPKVKRRAKG